VQFSIYGYRFEWCDLYFPELTCGESLRIRPNHTETLDNRDKRCFGWHILGLRRDAHAIAPFAHAALDRKPSAELLGDLLHVATLP